VIPDLSVLWVIFFVLLLVGLINKLLFQPVLRVMHEREGAISSAKALAQSAASKADQAAAEYEARTSAARAEVYKEMDDTRRAALDRRTEVLAATRREAEMAVSEATERVRAEAAGARAVLASEGERLGAAIVERVLGRRAS
jgi:F-type H+-transporting ATPase subunit b